MKVFRALVVFFVVLPLIELWVLYRLGARFGFFETIGALILVGFVGASLAKREGLRVLGEWNRSLAEGRVPEEGVLSGVLSLGAAALFVLPGVISDVVGLFLLFPPTRRLVAAWLRRRFEQGAASGDATVFTVGSFGDFGGFRGPDAGPFGRPPFGGDPPGDAPRGVGPSSRRGPRTSSHRGEIIDVVGEDVTGGPELDPARTLPRPDDPDA